MTCGGDAKSELSGFSEQRTINVASEIVDAQCLEKHVPKSRVIAVLCFNPIESAYGKVVGNLCWVIGAERSSNADAVNS